MLTKLLKYDLKSVFRYWWIAAVASLILSVVGSVCIRMLDTEREIPDAALALAMLVLVLVVMSYSVFVFVTMILVFFRFYKNLFTDEGYLTFTLPVRKTQILNSKLIMSVIAVTATYAACVMNILIMLFLVAPKEFLEEVFLDKELWKDVAELFEMAVDEMGVYLVIYLLEVIAILVLCVIFSNLFLYCCITLASIIMKKAKVITAIGIYYVASGVLSVVGQILYLFAIPTIFVWGTHFSASVGYLVIALIMFVVAIIVAIFCMILYILQYWMIDRKLNLS